MCTATQSVMLASFVSLALGVTPMADTDDKILQAAKCCDYENAVLSLFSTEPKTCVEFKSFEPDAKGGKAKEKTWSVLECYLMKNGLINKDMSVKEQGLRDLFIKKAHPDVKYVVQGALNTCFNEYNAVTDKNSVDAENLIACIENIVFTNCPKTLVKPDCQDYKETVSSDVTPKADTRDLPIEAECCEYERAMPLFYSSEVDICVGSHSIELDPITGTQNRVRPPSVLDCALRVNGLRNDDMSIKEQETRDLLMKDVHPDAKAILKVALDKCLKEYNGARDSSYASGSREDQLFMCIANVVLIGCPESMLDVYTQECRDYKEKVLKARIAARLKKIHQVLNAARLNIRVRTSLL